MHYWHLDIIANKEYDKINQENLDFTKIYNRDEGDQQLCFVIITDYVKFQTSP